jgi:ABC-2 type transport system permease protein
MNLLKQELKFNFKPLLFWSIGLFILAILGMQDYVASMNAGESIKEIMDAMPKEVRVIFGVGQFDVGTLSGYFGMLYLYLIITTGLHATLLGSNILTKEERDKTSEFLYVKPISRHKVINMKLVAAIINIIIVNIVTLIGSLIATNIEGDINMTDNIIKLMAGMLLFQLIFLTLGLFISSFIKKSEKSRTITSVIFFVCFLLNVIVDLTDKLNFLKFVTPFKYFDAYNIMYKGGFEIIFIIITFILVGVFIYLTHYFYSKKDINV